MEIKSKLISSLDKCFWDEDIDKYLEIKEEKLFKNQKFSFQVVFRAPKDRILYIKPVIESDIKDFITIREVVNIPSDMPVYTHSDEDVLKREEGLYPDLLRPLKYSGFACVPAGVTRAFWFTLDCKGELLGRHNIKIKLLNGIYEWGLVTDGTVLAEEDLTVDIFDVMLPKQDLIFTQWFYADCLADYYNVEPLSDRHFEICEQYIKTAVQGGRNMMLIPLLTYSLDIYRDGYRTNVQLVDIYKNGDEYTFSYKNLDRWLDMCKRQGIEYYEICHLVSQWGAVATPLVMAHENGEYKRIFGWDTDSTGKEYKNFIRKFLTEFINHMKARGEDQKCWFHISDEPNEKHLAKYKEVRNMIYDVVKDYHTMDALSHYEFYEQGLINTPVPAIRSIRPFLDHKVPDLWCYYCGGHAIGVSNCHFSMSLSRTRYIGIQFFKYDIFGFLHWGYNFYNNQWSYNHLDPFLNSSGEIFGASGDMYMVYPAPDGTAWESNRFVAFFEGLEDLRALKLCASLYSKEEVVKAIEDICGEIVFDKCVCDTETMLKIRHTVQDMIFKRLDNED